MPNKKSYIDIAEEIKPFIKNRYNFVNYINSKNVILQDKYGFLKVSISDIKRNYDFTINSALEKNTYGINRIQERFPNIKILENNNIINGSSTVNIVDKYGELQYTYNELVLNKKTNIGIKSAKNKTSYFINMSAEIHNYIYDYSDTIYISSNKKVTIKCKEHGCFSVAPYHHIYDRTGMS